MARRLSLVSPQRALADVVRLTGSQRAAAKALRVSQPYLHQVLHGRKPCGDKLLRRLGLRTVTGRWDDEAGS